MTVNHKGTPSKNGKRDEGRRKITKIKGRHSQEEAEEERVRDNLEDEKWLAVKDRKKIK